MITPRSRVPRLKTSICTPASNSALRQLMMHFFRCNSKAEWSLSGKCVCRAHAADGCALVTVLCGSIVDAILSAVLTLKAAARSALFLQRFLSSASRTSEAKCPKLA